LSSPAKKIENVRLASKRKPWTDFSKFLRTQILQETGYSKEHFWS
jgi:hypothetical protein